MSENTNLFDFLREYLEENTEEGSYYDSYREMMFQSESVDEINTEEFGTIKVEHVDNYGGEGQGDDYWSVFKFTAKDQTVHIRFQGYYASYSGSEFSEMQRVEPYQTTVTKFQEI